ncbi:MAG: hypothetical protein M1818_005665 [Claussenomyces sp. TS43310]|nr:MAG: hypothetical protein M1818_005665 [Claussenomyces sp. TS43310]
METSAPFLDQLPYEDSSHFSHDELNPGALNLQHSDSSSTAPTRQRLINSSITSTNFNVPYQLNKSSSATMEWAGLPLTDYQFPLEDTYYGFTGSNNASFQESWISGLQEEDEAHPRRLRSSYDPRLLDVGSDMTSGYFPQHDVADYQSMEYVTANDTQELARLSISQSPAAADFDPHVNSLDVKPSMSVNDVASCRSSDDGEDDHTDGLSNGEERPADEPYARLIHRALMDAPNHAMVLQDIYQWFEQNTDKGRSKSTGWRNSIRHNLSMNAAFRKTDRKHSGEDVKKTSEWVLEDFAIKDGVTPTTRYRKNNKPKGARPHYPAVSRQAAGHAGGTVAARAKSQQRSKQDLKPTSGLTRMQRRMDSPARYPLISYPNSRHLSPTTPTIGEIMPISGPYYMKPVFDGLQYDMDYTCGNVNGILDDGGPLFCQDDHVHLDPRSHVWSDCGI